MNRTANAPSQGRVALLITVAALGYFVDIYDLVLFNVVKRESLTTILGADHPDLVRTGIMLFNWQMMGMLVGGVLWGIWGDRKGRITVLFGSILLYSVANILNAFTFDVKSYAAVRFVAGIGLAGELGAGITLIAETMPRHTRGYGTMVVVVLGALGAVFAAEIHAQGQVIGTWATAMTGVTLLPWQIAYLVGGAMGLMLLALRMGTFESGLFKGMEHRVPKGDLRVLFATRERSLRYLGGILVGVPIWFVIGALVNLSQDVFVPALSIDTSLLPEDDLRTINGSAIKYTYLGLSVGDLLSASLSQLLRSRRKVILLFLVSNMVVVMYFLWGLKGASITHYFWTCGALGLTAGYWVLFVTLGAEQFGTNVRALAATSTPNFVRGSVWPVTALFGMLAATMGPVLGATLVGMACLGLALWALFRTRETFGSDLDHVET